MLVDLRRVTIYLMLAWLHVNHPEATKKASAFLTPVVHYQVYPRNQ